MPAKALRLSLQAVITEADDEFVVSVTLLSPQEDPAIVGEDFVATLDAADLFVEQLAQKMGYPPEKVEKMYVMASGIFSHRPQSPTRKKSVGKPRKKTASGKK
jgi:hypothetical protein